MPYEMISSTADMMLAVIQIKITSRTHGQLVTANLEIEMSFPKLHLIRRLRIFLAQYLLRGLDENLSIRMIPDDQECLTHDTCTS